MRREEKRRREKVEEKRFSGILRSWYVSLTVVGSLSIAS